LPFHKEELMNTGFTGRGCPRPAWIRALAVALLAVAVAVPPVSAQITRGAISGTVRDASDAVVPGASITVTNLDTNTSNMAVTDAEGFYRIGALEPGRYLVKAELAGFTTVETRDVVVRTGSEATVNVGLKVAALGEEVTVTAESVGVELNKTNANIAYTVTSRQVVDLPLSADRNINNLIATAPNVTRSDGQGTFAANGSRSRNNNYMIDGSDNNDVSVTISTSQVVPEAVAEFQVVTNPYNVEYGRNSGAQVNVITKSGTNRFRGEVWDYYRSNEFYSLNNIEKASGLSETARFNRHQAGASAGGPIIRDKTFFFGLYQYDSQRPGPTPGGTVRIPTPAGFAALQGVPIGAGQTAQSRSDVLQRISFLQDIYAQNVTFRNLTNTSVNGVPIQTGQTNVSIVAPSTYNTYFGRVDHQLGASDRLTFRYSLNDRVDDNLVSNCAFGSLFCGNQDTMDTNIAASDSHIFSSNMLNEFRFSLVRRNLDFPENDPESPTGTISGLFTIGGAANFPQSRVTDSYQFQNVLTWSLDRHTIKMGADVRYNKVDNESGFNSKGAFVFNNLQDYMNNFAFSFTQALQTASWYAKQWQTYFFAQDDFRVTDALTLNFGLRYEVSQVPLGMFGATDPESLSAMVPGEVEMDTNNWAPRVGFAWSPRSDNRFLGDGRTVLRGGFGIGYDVLFYNLLTVNASNYPRVVTALVNNVQNVYPNLLPVSAEAVFNPLAQWVNSAEDTQNPDQRYYSLGWQRELGRYVFEVGYTGSRGYHGINQIEMNPPVLTAEQAALVAATRNPNIIPGVQARRLYPQYGSRLLIPGYVGPADNDVEARSEYNAIFFSANRRFVDGFTFGGSYTYSEFMSNNDASLGEAGTAGSSQRPQSMFDYEVEWSRSQFDRPHRWVANFVWELPGPDAGFMGALFGGWQLSAVTSGQSGRPFTIRTGVDSNGDGSNGADRPNVNTSGSFTWDDEHQGFTNNGYYVVPLGTNGLPLANSLGDGNAARNSERAAFEYNTDASLQKRFYFGERYFSLRIDSFNVFNQDIYGFPDNSMNSASFGINTNNWGRRSFTVSGKFSW
jgi:hypothetical protein